MTGSTRRWGLTLTLGCALAAGLASPVLAADPDLIIFDWSGYEDPAFHPKYVEKNGDSPTFTFFGDEDEAFEKVRAGFKADLGHPCSQSVVKWREAGLLQPLDTSRIEGWGDLNPAIMKMKNLVTSEDGQVWFMPWDWGNSLLTYNPAKVPVEDTTTVKILADPKYKDRVSIPDNVDDAYGLAALAIGMHDWTEMTDEQFQQASAFLREVHKNVRLYWTDNVEIVQAMGGGEVDLAWAWNDAAAQLQVQGMDIKSTRDTAEGTTTFVCGYVRYKDAPGSADKAYDYLSAINTSEVARFLLTDWGYGHANSKAMATIDPAIVAEKGYADVEKFLDKTLFQSPLKTDLKLRMIAEFEKIKAGY